MNIVNLFVPSEQLNKEGILFCLKNFKEENTEQFNASWNNLSDLDKMYLTDLIIEDIAYDCEEDLLYCKSLIKNNKEFEFAVKAMYILNAFFSGEKDFFNLDENLKLEILEKMPDLLDENKYKNLSEIFYKNLKTLK